MLTCRQNVRTTKAKRFHPALVDTNPLDKHVFHHLDSLGLMPRIM
jgi:hypothetical protein